MQPTSAARWRPRLLGGAALSDGGKTVITAQRGVGVAAVPLPPANEPATAEPTAHAPEPEHAASAPRFGAFVPLLLGTLTLAGWMGYPSWTLDSDRHFFATSYATQTSAVVNVAKLRGSLDTPASRAGAAMPPGRQRQTKG